MTLKEIKDYFKSAFNWSDSISTGKIDNNKEQALCFYNSRRGTYRGTVGGKQTKSTTIKPITILLRYTKNQNKAELKAQEIFEFFEERTFFITEKRVFVQMQCPEPISLGTDNDGVYEYSIELDLYIER